MTEALSGAYAWLDRADEHLDELQAVRKEYVNAQLTFAAGSFDPAEKGFAFEWQADVPVRMPVLVGETIQALRRALDYLVFELALCDSGGLQHETQFPIEDNEHTFWHVRCKDAARGAYLRGLSGQHKRMISDLQPFRGVAWTKSLQMISNPDKHRTLTPTATSVGIAVKPGMEPPVPGTLVVTATNNETGEVDMQYHIAISVAFDDGSDVLATLTELASTVRQTLAAFTGEFD